MARSLRNWFPNAKFHITSRGIRKLALFYEEEDYLTYLALIGKTKNLYPFILHTYCLMTNHTHLQLETVEIPPSQIMKYINTNYAKYFNKKYEFSGHVFEKRYGGELIASREYELDVSKYIHMNPVKAGIVAAPEDYPWSSYRAYWLGEESPHIHKQQILSHFSYPEAENYAGFVQSPFKESSIFFENKEEGLCGQK